MSWGRPWPTQRHRAIALAGILAGVCAGADEAPDARASGSSESEVRPLFAAKCQKCHGPRQQKGGLRLDSRPARARREARPGRRSCRATSRRACSSTRSITRAWRCPRRASSTPRRSPSLTRWVELGAPWPALGRRPRGTAAPGEDHRGRPQVLVVPAGAGKPPVPAVDDGGWSRNPIDRFLFARLAAEGLTPAPEADRRDLDPPRDLRPDRAAADARMRSRRSWSPMPPEGLRAPDRPAAGEPALRRALGPALARPGALRRVGRLPRGSPIGPRPGGIATTSSGAFNDDMPYDRFVTEQLAGDEVAPGDSEP